MGNIFIGDDDDAKEEEGEKSDGDGGGGGNNNAIIIKLSQKCCCKGIMLAPNEPIKLNILQLPKNVFGKILSPHSKLHFSFHFTCVRLLWCGAFGFSSLAHGKQIWRCAYAFDVELRLEFGLRNIIHLNKFYLRELGMHGKVAPKQFPILAALRMPVPFTISIGSSSRNIGKQKEHRLTQHTHEQKRYIVNCAELHCVPFCANF